MNKLLLTMFGLLVMSSLALAQATTDTANAAGTSGTTVRQARKNVQPYGGTACGSDPILPTDGSAIQDFVDVGAITYYMVHLKSGHSYSAEMYDSQDATISVPGQLQLWNTGCGSQLPTTDVASLDPDLSNNFSDRISWIQSGDSDAILEVINTDTVNTYVYTIRITDTTLHNQRWSTFTPFSTQYSFVNNTDVNITGTLTLYNTSGAVLNSVPITVNAGAQLFYIFSTPPNQVGNATFAFIGPAGGITADAFFLNTGATVVVPSTFAPRNYQH